jgi:4'-phosphopantetheinyl transferase
MPVRRLVVPNPGSVHLWFLDLQELGNPLDPDDRARAPHWSPRQRRALRRFYLRLLLGAYLGLPGKDVVISRLVKGKPVLTGAAARERLDFSVANSGGCCLVALASAGLVGVDLELAGRTVGDPLKLAGRYFSPAEAAALAALDRRQVAQAFLHAWACKEALVKAAGHGIANQLDRFTVSCDPAAPPRVLAMQDDDPEAWRLAVVRPSTRHVGAVALRSAVLEIEPFRLVPRA